MLTSGMLALRALLMATSASAYFILGHGSLLATRLDPIVSPGQIASHVHSVVGASNFDKTVTYDSLRQSSCTTAPVSVDLSSYWVPQLYYYRPSDQSYTLIPVGFVNTYYLPRGPNNSNTVKAFPDGLRMIAGDPNRRTYNSSSFADQAISFVCLDYYNSHKGDASWDQRNNFFQHNCPNGMRVQINFPSCWDGVNLDSSDHKSHMAYASGGPNGGGDCPSTHPVHLVTLFYEFVYNVQDFPFNDLSQPTWVFANGDATGYGSHGDFVNGWPTNANGNNILQQAINQCNDNNGVGGNLKDCPPFVPYLDNAKASSCRPQNPQVNEDIGLGHYISALPGNNPLWTGTGTKPSNPSYSPAPTTFTNGQSTIPSGYSLVGCVAEASSGRALQGASFSNSNMTRAVCVQWCSDRGYPLAGIEWSRECYCDNTMRGDSSNTTLLSDSSCGMACANNPNENCGGSKTLTLFSNPSKYPAPMTLPTGWTSNGCYTDPLNPRGLNSYSFASDQMTPTLCMQTCQQKGYTYAGTEYSRECFCGNSFQGTSAKTNSDSECSMACSGNSQLTCGGPARLTTYKYTKPSQKSRRFPRQWTLDE